MKVFLSLGFKGRTEKEVKLKIEGAKKIISIYRPNESLEFVHNYDYEGNNRVECLGEAIKKMSICDYIYFIDDWFNYNGCIIEKQVCELYNIPFEAIMVPKEFYDRLTNFDNIL